MENLTLVKSARFGSLVCDFWGNGNDDVLLTREQVGRALEYSDPIRAISKLHDRHGLRLNQFSVVTKVTTTDGKQYDTCLYTPKGVYEVCRWSRQPKADAFYDFVYEILEGLRTGRLRLETAEINKISKMIRHELTDVIKESGLNEQMHGFGYKQFTDLNYKLLTGMNAKQLREIMGLKPGENVKEHLNEFQKMQIVKLEDAARSMINIGMGYQDIKQFLSNKFLKRLG